MTQLLDKLRDCSSALHDECIRRVGHAHLFKAKAKALSFTGPPVFQRSDLLGVDITSLPKLLYNEPVISEPEVITLWNRACQLFDKNEIGIRETKLLFSPVFPRVPFPMKWGDDLRVPMCIFLVCCSWHTGELTITNSAITLKLGSFSLGINPRSIEHGTPDRPLRMMDRAIDFHPLQVVMTPLGPRKKCRQSTSSLYTYLHRMLPELGSTLDAVFQTAVYAGPEAESALYQAFDIEQVEDFRTVDIEVWRKALNLIDDSFLNPYRKLMKLLVPVEMTRTAFIRLFGTPPARSEVFQPKDRAKFRRVAAAARDQAVSKPEEADQPEENETVKIIELQRMMGGAL